MTRLLITAFSYVFPCYRIFWTDARIKMFWKYSFGLKKRMEKLWRQCFQQHWIYDFHCVYVFDWALLALPLKALQMPLHVGSFSILLLLLVYQLLLLPWVIIIFSGRISLKSKDFLVKNQNLNIRALLVMKQINMLP